MAKFLRIDVVPVCCYCIIKLQQSFTYRQNNSHTTGNDTHTQTRLTILQTTNQKRTQREGNANRLTPCGHLLNRL